VLIHHHLYAAREASPARQFYSDHGYRGARKIALGTNIRCTKYCIHYVPGPTCRGSVPLYVPPLSYKRGGMQRYKIAPKKRRNRPRSPKTQLKLTSNTKHSGVGYYAPAARTTLNSCMFLCVHSQISQQAKRLGLSSS
jgi:hypothetical protein